MQENTVSRTGIILVFVTLLLALSVYFFVPVRIWLFSAVLGIALLYLAYSDLRHMVLPDLVTVPLLIAGFAFHYWQAPQSFPDSLIGAAAGFFFIVGVNEVYRLVRGRDGLGMGDAKLLAAGGSWLGWQSLPLVLLIASLIGIGTAYIQSARQNRSLSATTAVPFGLYIAIAIWVMWCTSG